MAEIPFRPKLRSESEAMESPACRNEVKAGYAKIVFTLNTQESCDLIRVIEKDNNTLLSRAWQVCEKSIMNFIGHG